MSVFPRTLLVLTAGAPITRAAARREVAAVPVPAGAVLQEETSECGPILVRASSRATRLYTLPLPVDAACAVVVRGALTAGYTVIRFQDVAGPPVVDADAACAADLVMIAFPPGVDARSGSGSFSLVTTDLSPPQPGRSVLRVAMI